MLKIIPDYGQKIKKKTQILFSNGLMLWDRWYKWDPVHTKRI
jgi:hypothetical protein